MGSDLDIRPTMESAELRQWIAKLHTEVDDFREIFTLRGINQKKKAPLSIPSFRRIYLST